MHDIKHTEYIKTLEGWAGRLCYETKGAAKAQPHPHIYKQGYLRVGSIHQPGMQHRPLHHHGACKAGWKPATGWCGQSSQLQSTEYSYTCIIPYHAIIWWHLGAGSSQHLARGFTRKKKSVTSQNVANTRLNYPDICCLKAAMSHWQNCRGFLKQWFAEAQVIKVCIFFSSLLSLESFHLI